MTDPCKTVSGRIKYARERAEMTAKAMRGTLQERGITLSKTGLHRLETVDAKNPNLKLIAAIGDITNVSPSWLLFGEGTPESGSDRNATVRIRAVNAIEEIAQVLNLTGRQRSTIENWIRSVRESTRKRRN